MYSDDGGIMLFKWCGHIHVGHVRADNQSSEITIYKSLVKYGLYSINQSLIRLVVELE